jgi:hypothetical protein
MKNFIAVAFSVLIALTGFAQQHHSKISNNEWNIRQTQSKVNQQNQFEKTKLLHENLIPKENVTIVSILNIGTDTNAYSYENNLSYLCSDPDLNTVSNFHHLVDTNEQRNFGKIGYDISKNGGISWENMITVYQNQMNQGYVIKDYNAGIFNPTGYTDPDNAYLNYVALASAIDENQANTYVVGVTKLGDTSYHSTTFLPPNNRFHPFLPKGYDLTSQGNVYIVDANVDRTNGQEDYLDSLIITKGT